MRYAFSDIKHLSAYTGSDRREYWINESCYRDQKCQLPVIEPISAVVVTRDKKSPILQHVTTVLAGRDRHVEEL